MILTVSLLGMVVIAGLGLLGRRGASGLEEWTVGGRGFGKASAWFLQAGEAFTTFTFLGVANLTLSGGASSTYAIPYIPLGIAAAYYLGPRLWEIGSAGGYLTQADFFADRYRSPLFGKLVAVVGVVFLLPYLQLQVTGLGTIVQLVTGSESSGRWSMGAATVLTVAFVLWSGLRGIATTAYLKDALMILVVVVLAVAIPAHFAGGVGDVFRQLQSTAPDLLHVAHGDRALGGNWWISGVLISAIGTALYTMPHLWPPLLAARDARVVRNNAIWLPLYQVVIILPIIIGFTGVLAAQQGHQVPKGGVLLWLSGEAVPDWLVGLVAVAGASAAMVPAAVICLSMSSLVAHNLVPVRSERGRLAVNHGVVVASAGLALLLGLTRPDALADLLLLTFSGLAQSGPALLAALGARRLLAAWPAMLGMATGIGVVAWVELGKHQADVANINSGLVALGANIAVAAVAQLVHLAVRRPPATPPAPAPKSEVNAR